MILIIGATGYLGGATARRLLASGELVRAMTRTPEKAQELQALGAEVVQGDLRDEASLRSACIEVKSNMDPREESLTFASGELWRLS